MPFLRKSKYNKHKIEELFKDNYQKVFKTAMAVTLDSQLSYDVTQEAFYRAFLRINTLKDIEKFGQWVCSIAINVSKDMLRTKIFDRERTIPILNNEGQINEGIDELIDFSIPEDIYEKKEVREEVIRIIRNLDVETQQIINLKFYLGFSYKEISQKLSIKESNVKIKIFRAKKKILYGINQFINFEERGVL